MNKPHMPQGKRKAGEKGKNRTSRQSLKNYL